ncbi:MAG TPA: hypothetical protein DCS29_02350 [Candidatus Magasanikbacteria bacterium]|nr:MAG: hypothetical protein A2479_02135 [Candidatus Magasanikbacteria bacterium RIFOXYC2_FULL_39_8]HAT03598.1 hypothetical protein [Candidatus Magasanikbacteria bacterium]
MSKIPLYVILVFIFTAGCSLTQPPKSSTTNTHSNSETTTSEILPENKIDIDNTVTGTARITKGGQIMVTDILLSDEQVHLISLSSEDLEGKTVEMRGDVVTTYCSKYDQCLSGEEYNYIKRIENVVYMRAFEDN